MRMANYQSTDLDTVFLCEVDGVFVLSYCLMCELIDTVEIGKDAFDTDSRMDLVSKYMSCCRP